MAVEAAVAAAVLAALGPVAPRACASSSFACISLNLSQQPLLFLHLRQFMGEHTLVRMAHGMS